MEPINLSLEDQWAILEMLNQMATPTSGVIQLLSRIVLNKEIYLFTIGFKGELP